MTVDSRNPYQSPTQAESVQDAGGPKPIGRIATLFAALVICCGVTVALSEFLSFVVLLPPMNRWFSMRGEFSGLILIGMPIWAGGYSLFAALILGFAYPRSRAGLFAMVFGSLAILVVQGNLLRSIQHSDEWYSALTVSGIVLISLNTGVAVAQRGLFRIYRNRSKPEAGIGSKQTPSRGLRISLLVCTAATLSLDLAVIGITFQDPRSFWNFPVGLVAFTVGLGVISFCVYVSLARTTLRTTGFFCFALSSIGFGFTLYYWVRVAFLGLGV